MSTFVNETLMFKSHSTNFDTHNTENKFDPQIALEIETPLIVVLKFFELIKR